MGKFIRKQWIVQGRSHSLVSEFVESPEFYSWLNVDGVCDFSEPLLLKKGPRELSLGKAGLSILALFSGCVPAGTPERSQVFSFLVLGQGSKGELCSRTRRGELSWVELMITEALLHCQGEV